jgi:hypothetical protein
MASQFFKRKAKEAVKAASEDKGPMESVEVVPVEVATVEIPVVVAPEPLYTQEALDVYSGDGGKTYNVAEIQYNPLTNEAKVKTIYNISRLVGMQHTGRKEALVILRQKLKVK